MLHPRQVSQLGVFFDAYDGAIPPWQARHAVMLGRCRSLLNLSHQREPGNLAFVSARTPSSLGSAYPFSVSSRVEHREMLLPR